MQTLPQQICKQTWISRTTSWSSASANLRMSAWSTKCEKSISKTRKVSQAILSAESADTFFTQPLALMKIRKVAAGWTKNLKKDMANTKEGRLQFEMVQHSSAISGWSALRAHTWMLGTVPVSTNTMWYCRTKARIQQYMHIYYRQVEPDRWGYAYVQM